MTHLRTISLLVQQCHLAVNVTCVMHGFTMINISPDCCLHFLCFIWLINCITSAEEGGGHSLNLMFYSDTYLYVLDLFL